MAQRIFAFGYGSLINQGSLLHTLRGEDLGLIVAGRIGGFRRSWSNRSEVRKRTGLSVRKCESAHLNGVSIEVSPSQLQDLDVREAGFGRVIVEDQDLVDGTLWIYTKPEPKPRAVSGVPRGYCGLARSFKIGASQPAVVCMNSPAKPSPRARQPARTQST